MENSDRVYLKLFSGFLSAVIFVFILKELKGIFIPFFIALLLYFLFNGVVNRLLYWRVPKTIVMIFLLVFIFILLYFFGLLIFSGISSFVDKFPEYNARISEIAKDISHNLKLPVKELQNQINNYDWTNIFGHVTQFLSSAFGSFANFIGNLLFIVIFLIFMLGGRNSLMNRVRGAFSKERAESLISIVKSIENQVQHYLVLKTIVSFLTAFISGLIIYAGRFDFLLFSVILIFILNFIPNIGSVFATAFPILTGLLKYGFTMRVLLVSVGLMLTQMIIGNVIEPKFAGRNLDISPMVILISLIFWGYVWGITGMMLAVPLTSAIKIIFSHIELLKPVSKLMSSE